MSESSMALARTAVLALADREPELAPRIRQILRVAEIGQVTGLNFSQRSAIEYHIGCVVAQAIPPSDPLMDDRRCALEGIFRHACAGVLEG